MQPSKWDKLLADMQREAQRHRQDMEAAERAAAIAKARYEVARNLAEDLRDCMNKAVTDAND